MEIKITLDATPTLAGLLLRIADALAAKTVALTPAETVSPAAVAASTTAPAIPAKAAEAATQAADAQQTAAPVQERTETKQETSIGGPELRRAMDGCRERIFGSADRSAVSDDAAWKALNAEFLYRAKTLGNCKPSELTGTAAAEFVDVCARIDRAENGTYVLKDGDCPF